MSNIKVCKNCGSTDIEVDRAKGITCCTQCAEVLEESIIVSEVTIEEGAGGAMNVVGQFVGINDVRSNNISGLQHRIRESTEITLQNGKRLINEMGSQLRLNDLCMDMSFKFYKMAVTRGLTRGRKIRQVIAACLYLACRTEGTPHMLLDLCDIVHDDSCYISSLGKLAMKFANLMSLKLAEIDPSLFIPRFAHKLDFGDKVHEVTLTALRLVQRMSRDWMATGRRPSGLCGAALLVAARMYGFERSLDDIVKVVKIGKTTLRKRMIEFEDTPSSMLTIDEFHTIDLEEEHDAPAYTRSKKFAKIQQIEEMANIEEIEREILKLQDSIETALKKLQKPRGLLAKYAKLDDPEEEFFGSNKELTPGADSEINEAEDFLTAEQIHIIRSIVGDSGILNDVNDVDDDEEVVDDRAETWNKLGLRPTLESLGLRSKFNENSHDDYDNDDDDHPVSESANNGTETVIGELNESASLIKTPETDVPRTSNETVVLVENAEELDLNGIDDAEIDSMILSQNEIKTKAKLWFKANKDWLKDQKLKEEQKKKDIESKVNEPKAKKPRIRKPKTAQTPVANAHEAVEKLVQEKKISSKINYDVLKNLNKDLKRKV